MNARVLIIVIYSVSIIYDLIKMKIADIQRRKPLPEEVNDIYEPERYQSYINRTADNRKVALLKLAADTLINIIILFSPLFMWTENRFSGNVYLCYLFAMAVTFIISTAVNTVFDWYTTFRIDEKYGLNKKDGKEFAKEETINAVSELVLNCIIYLVLIFIFTHMEKWTNGFALPTGKVILIASAIIAVIAAVVLLVAWLSIAVMKIQYTFTPLENGQLRDDINALQKDSRKKVKIINVYNESKKSVRKNAFLLKLLWHREFGIADNFITDNAQRELLAVLAHEVGHLKHKKGLLDYLKYLAIVLAGCALVYFMINPEFIFSINSWLRNSFSLKQNSYYVIFMFYETVLTPLLKIFTIFSNYVSRVNEYEADMNSVREGYGNELIKTFKELSSDELINVYPSDIIEFLEYDHPGMYNRIRAILAGMKEVNTDEKA